MGHQPETRRWTFSLGVLFRAVTLIAFALGWPLLVWKAEPLFVRFAVVGLGVVLGVVVGVRRFGTPRTRFKAMIGFVIGASIVAEYSTCIAWLIHKPEDPPGTQWSGLMEMQVGLALLAALPIIVIILVLLLRAWTWSAHDQSIHFPQRTADH
jgi:hypothetical protein